MRFSHFAGLFGLASTCLANTTPAGTQLCVASCQEALAYITFSDVTSTDYYKALCDTKLRAESLFLCAKLYCNPDEIIAGFQWVKQYCEQYAYYTPAPYHVDPSITREKLKEKALDDEAAFHSGKALNRTVIPAAEKYKLTYRTLDTWQYQLKYDDQYGWAMYVYWGGVVIISLLAKASGHITAKSSRQAVVDVERNAAQTNSTILGRLNLKLNYLLWTPASLGHRSVAPYGWFTVPPLLQSLTVLGFIVLNVIFCATPYHLFPGNTYWRDENLQIWRYFADRTGIIAFANLPILWLFGTRNNFLLWLTGWSPATFNSFHRWVARLATLEAILHSVGYTVFTLLPQGGTAAYDLSWKARYWQFGAVATILMSVLCGISLYGLRKRAYDLFLLIHIVSSIVILIACFFHVKIFDGQYNSYLYATTAIWSFDRLARIVRIIVLNFNRFNKGQQATATYSEGSNIISLDVPIATSFQRAPGSFYYVYVLSGWMSYQSHPFTSSFRLVSKPGRDSTRETDSAQQSENNKEAYVVVDSASSNSSASTAARIDYSHLKFHIRPFTGFTARLRDLVIKNQGQSSAQVRVLVEGPYGTIEPIHDFDNVFFIVGGSGITVALQYLQALLSKKREGKACPKVHMLWAVRQTWMLQDLGPEVRAYENELGIKFTTHATGNRGFSTSMGKDEVGDTGLEIAGWSVLRGRPDLDTAVKNQRSDACGSLAVVSCCPPGMADDSRRAVVGAMRETQLDIKYFQESFSW